MNCNGRTIDGEINVVADDIATTDLEVSGTATINNLFVSGITTIPGGVIDLTDITAESLIVEGSTELETLTVLGTSTLASVTATAIQGTTVTSTGNVVGVGANFSGLTANQIVATDGSKNLVSKATTGSGDVVLATAPTISGLTLGTPLAVTSGGTGQTSLTAVTVGNATNAAFATTAGTATNATNAVAAVTALNINAGGVGQLVTQTGLATTGFTLPGTAGTVLTSNGTLSMPTFQTPSVGTVSGVLPVVNGGTGVTTATGTGSVVRSIAPTFTGLFNNGGTDLQNVALLFPGPGISLNVLNNTTDSTTPATGSIRTAGGIGVAKQIVSGSNIEAAGQISAGGLLYSSSSNNAVSLATGAINAINGGISCGQDAYIGGRVFAKSTAEATNTLNGAFQTSGGISTVKNAFIGGDASADSFVARDTTQSTGSFTGAIQSSGGIYADRDIYGAQTVKASNFFLHAQGHNLNFDEGTFTPFMQAEDPTNDALLPTFTYSIQQGYWQNCNQFTFIYLKIAYTVPASLPSIRASIGGIPGTYFTNQSMTFSDNSVFYKTGLDAEHLQPFQICFDSTYNRWMIMGFRQFVGGMINTYKLYDGTAVGDQQFIVCNAVMCRTTL